MNKFTGLEYLKIDIANNAGLDKADWQERIDWVNKNIDSLEDITDLDEPAQYYAGVQALRDHQAGKPSGYPISLDASASGLQILAALCGDVVAGKICNIVNTGHNRDAYTEVYKVMQNLGASDGIDREDVKSAVMPSFYGSTAAPKRVFGEGHNYMVFQQAMGESMPAVWKLIKLFLDIWDNQRLTYEWVLPDNFHVVIKTMDKDVEVVSFNGHRYEVPYKVHRPINNGRHLAANVTHSLDGMVVREMQARIQHDPEQVRTVKRILYTVPSSEEVLDTHDARMVLKLWNHYSESGFLSSRIIEHINEDTVSLIPNRYAVLKLLESFPEKPFHMIVNHDCFRVLPNNGNDLRQQYINVLAELAESNMLQFILRQLVLNPKLTVKKESDDLASLIREADYPLT